MIKPRVAFYLSGYEKGGAANSIALLIENIDRKQFDIFLIFNEAGHYYDRLKAYDNHKVLLNVKKPLPMQIIQGDKWKHNKFAMIQNIGWFLKTIFKLRKSLKKYKIDIVHSNGGYISLIAGCASLLMKTKSVWHLRGIMSKNVSWGIFQGYLGFFAALITDRFIGISKIVVENMPNSWKKKAIVIYNGIDINKLSISKDINWFRHKLNLMENVFLVGIVGSIIPVKGHKILLDAANIICHNNKNIKFIIIGSSPESAKNFEWQLKELEHKYNLSESIFWLGNIPNAALYLGGLNVLVSATLPPGEGFGLTIVEAMCQGVPVISTSCGAAPELIPENNAGIIIKPEDHIGLTEAILELYTNKEKCKTFQCYAKKWAEENFNISDTVNKLQNLYNNMLI